MELDGGVGGCRYTDHLLHPAGSLISRYFMHFRNPGDGRNFVAMNNWLLPPQGDESAGVTLTYAYDLKV